mmetsp:Transcript_145108/g.253096  ORF Transcript_145108/g.253096 Transcript_145108/m.253096 type:complete len:259 (+) Transcript_145108:447-1223(+)
MFRNGSWAMIMSRTYLSCWENLCSLMIRCVVRCGASSRRNLDMRLRRWAERLWIPKALSADGAASCCMAREAEPAALELELEDSSMPRTQEGSQMLLILPLPPPVRRSPPSSSPSSPPSSSAGITTGAVWFSGNPFRNSWMGRNTSCGKLNSWWVALAARKIRLIRAAEASSKRSEWLYAISVSCWPWMSSSGAVVSLMLTWLFHLLATNMLTIAPARSRTASQNERKGLCRIRHATAFLWVASMCRARLTATPVPTE